MKVIKKFDGKKIQLELTFRDLQTITFGLATAGEYMKTDEYYKGREEITEVVLDYYWNINRASLFMPMLSKKKVRIDRADLFR